MHFCILHSRGGGGEAGRLLIMLKGALIVLHVRPTGLIQNCSRCSAIIVQHYTDDCYMMVIVNW